MRAPGSSRPVPPPLDLTIAGAPCRIRRDDGVARSLAGEAELMDYYGGGGGGIGCDGGDGVDGGEGSGTRPLLMDRYDARTLLDMLPDTFLLHFQEDRDTFRLFSCDISHDTEKKIVKM